MSFLKQSTAVTIKFGPFLDKDDGVSEETGLTIAQADIRLSKNGGNIAQSNNAAGATHDELGYYDVPLDTTDTDTLGILKVAVHDNTTHLPAFKDFMVLPANVWDSLFGSDKLQVDVTQLAGVTQSLTDLKDFADEGYDPATNKVEGVKTVDTTTTNTDMVGTDNASLASALSSHDGKLDTAQTDLDTLTGADGATLATTQGNYAPAKAGDLMNLVADQSAATVGTVTDVTNDVGITQAGADKVFGSSGAAIPEPSAGAPPATPKPREVFGWLWAHFRNKGTLNKTTGEAKVYNDAGSVIAKGTDSDDGTTFTKGELGAP